jgi:hypothetical protein
LINEIALLAHPCTHLPQPMHLPEIKYRSGPAFQLSGL